MLSFKCILLSIGIITFNHTIFCQQPKSESPTLTALVKSQSKKEILEAQRKKHLASAMNAATDTFPVKFAWHTFKLTHVTKEEATQLANVIYNRKRWVPGDYGMEYTFKFMAATGLFLLSSGCMVVFRYIDKTSIKDCDLAGAFYKCGFIGSLYLNYKTIPYLMDAIGDPLIQDAMKYSVRKKVTNSAFEKKE